MFNFFDNEWNPFCLFLFFVYVCLFDCNPMSGGFKINKLNWIELNWIYGDGGGGGSRGTVYTPSPKKCQCKSGVYTLSDPPPPPQKKKIFGSMGGGGGVKHSNSSHPPPLRIRLQSNNSGQILCFSLWWTAIWILLQLFKKQHLRLTIIIHWRVIHRLHYFEETGICKKNWNLGKGRITSVSIWICNKITCVH